MYVVVETDGAYSDKEWAVRGLFSNVKDASKFAWRCMLMPRATRDHHAKYWCDPSKKSRERREKSAMYGVEFHILEWDMRTNMHVGTWYLEPKSFFLELGQRGELAFRDTMHKFVAVLHDYVPGKLWHECMTYQKREHP